MNAIGKTLAGGIEMAELENVLSGRFRRVGIDEIDILIMSRNMLKKVLRYKKQGRCPPANMGRGTPFL